MLSTMQDGPLLVSGILRHGQQVYGDSVVITVTAPTGDGIETGFGEVAERAERLANALSSLGIGDSDRVGTFLWNNQTHLEAYFAVPGMGAVLHTLNLRLPPEQLAFVINHAEDRVIVVDGTLAPLLARVRDQLSSVKHVVMVGPGDDTGLGEVLSYEELVGAEEPGYDWPEFDERNAASMCYTSGTTGDPKGVAYSHRSTYLHALGVSSGAALGITQYDRVLLIVPMFHVNAWGAPYAAFLGGTDLLMPQMFLQAEPLSAIIARHRPTYSAGVPTIWNDLLRYTRDHQVDLSPLRQITAGGAAVPRQLIEGFRDELGIELVQGWGMTETSPMCALAKPPKGVPPEEEIVWRSKTGRIVPGVEVRVAAEDGSILPNDGVSIGEFEVRGPWITASYFKNPAPDRFHDGWLRTGDIGTLDGRGFMQISDRTKDVIKSGGEWISSVELENHVMAHPQVLEAAVIAVPDERWSERPLVAVVLEEGSTVSADELVAFLAERVTRWWLPERWTFVEEVPKTSVGKFDKKVLRARHAEGGFEIVEVVVSTGR
ncbi:MAG: long-chain fatty acid--CoA ligase [Acidimicrobiales bacterium]